MPPVKSGARAAATVLPSASLWGPGTRTEAVDRLTAHRPEPDQCDSLDQVVLVPTVDGRVDLPVHPPVAAGPTVRYLGTMVPEVC